MGISGEVLAQPIGQTRGEPCEVCECAFSLVRPQAI